MDLARPHANAHDRPTTTQTAKETEAGNYFVSNYPPYSFWQRSSADVDNFLDGPPQPTSRSGSIFTFRFAGSAATSVTSASTPTRIRRRSGATSRPHEGALDVTRQARSSTAASRTSSTSAAARRAIFQSRQLKTSPTHEGPAAVGRGRRGHLRGRARHAHRAKLEAIRDLGVTRLSLGVENFDDHILEINGRAHRSKEIIARLQLRPRALASRKSTSTSSPAWSRRRRRTGRRSSPRPSQCSPTA